MPIRVSSAALRRARPGWKWALLVGWWGFFLLVLAFGADYIFYLRARPPTEARIAAARKRGVAFDERSALAYFLEQVRKNPQAVPLFPVSMRISLASATVSVGGTELFPLAGVSNAETLYCNENGYHTVFASDEHGFRNPQGSHSEPAEVVLLGDSFAQGACVESDRNVAALFREAGLRTVNLAYANSSSLMQLAVLKEFAAPLKPQTIVWMFYEGNDFGELNAELGYPTLPRYLEGGYRQDLASHQPDVDRALRGLLERHIAEVLKTAEASTHIATDVLLLRHLRPAILPRKRVDLRPVIRRIYQEAQRTAAAWDGKILVVYLPEYQSVAHRSENRDKAQVIEELAAIGIPVLDLTLEFRKQPEPLAAFPFGLPGHYTEAGYRLVADAVLKQIGHPRQAASLTPIPRP